MIKIVVIDDTELVLKKVKSMLETEQFLVFTANNGVTGYELVKKELPQLVICDIEMPEMNGYEVLESLIKNENTSTIPFIFITAAKIKRSEIRYGMTLGADDYLTKPFNKEELLSAVNSRLEKQEEYNKKTEKKLQELRSNISYALPHEFRTPLSTILMSSSFITNRIEHMSKDAIQQMSRKINLSAKRLHQLIENFLLYVQIETLSTNTEKLEQLKEKHTNKTKNIISQTAKFKALEMNREKDLLMEIENDHVYITDQSLEKITAELIDNAFKFSEKDSLVKITAQKTKDNSAYEIRFIDRGRGMNEEQIKKIGVYMQFDRKIYEQQGSGFGLTIAKRLTEMHKGNLYINSKYGEYTEIIISLRIYQQS